MQSEKIAVLLYALVGSVAIPVNVRAEQEVAAVAGPPELRVVVALDGRTLEVRRFVNRMVTRTTAPPLPPGVTIKMNTGSITAPTTSEVVPVIETQITRIDAATVVARRIDGRAVSYKVLMGELAKPTPIIVAKPGQQVDPLFATMFKPDSLVLSWPALTAVDFSAPPRTIPGGQ